MKFLSSLPTLSKIPKYRSDARRQILFAAVLLIACATGTVVRASAQVGFTFSVADQATNAGADPVFYDGTITNGAQPAILEAYSVNFGIAGAADTAPLEDYFTHLTRASI